MTIAGKPLAGVCVSTAVFVCGAMGFPTAPDELPPSSGAVVLNASAGSPLDLAPGADLDIRGSGFADFAAVTVAVYSTPTDLARVVSDDDGEINTVVSLPKDLVGDHTLTAIGNGPQGEPVSLQARVSIETAPASTGGVTSLPQTGLNLAGIALGGLGLLLAGFVLIRTAVFRRKLLPT